MSHQGFGFCEFVVTEDAEYACKIMNQVRHPACCPLVALIDPGTDQDVWETDTSEYGTSDLEAMKSGRNLIHL